MKKTASTHKVWLETHGHWVHFTPRSKMKRVVRAKASLPEVVPHTTLPVDCTGNATVSCPMLGNDRYGDCGPVMCAHVDQIRCYGQGHSGFVAEAVNQAALVNQYEVVSGGDNGTDEDMLVGNAGGAGGTTGPGIWLTGIANDPSAVVVDHLDVDVTNRALADYCIDQFYAVCMAWSVPDAFLQGFATGTAWLNAMIPNPDHGHYTPLSDIDVQGNYRLFTWGGWCLVGPAMVASVQPECFVTFSALQFNKATGYDSHGRHVSDQAAKWVAIGGDAAKVAAVVAKFPPKVTPPGPVPQPPNPVPVPTPPAPPAPKTATLDQAVAWATAGLTNHWPK